MDVGDAPILPTNVVDTFAGITAMVQKILQRGAIPAALGGDHAISRPVVDAFAEHEPIHVIQFDAHLDYMPVAHGMELTNGNAFRHIANSAHVTSLAQVGVNGIRNPRAWIEDSVADGNRVILIDEFREGALAEHLAGLPAGARCYVSIDVDVLYMPPIPGCASGEPAGCSTRSCATRWEQLPST